MGEGEGLEALKRAHLAEDALLQVMVEGGNIDAIVELLAELLGNPVAVADQLFHLITSSPKSEHGDLMRREAIRRGGTGRDVLDDPVIGEEFRRVAEERRPRLFPAFPEHGMALRRLMAPILAGKNVLGFVTILEESRPLREDDAVVLQQASLVLALELLRQRALLEAEMRLRADFLRDLFGQDYESREAIGLRASLLGIALFRPWDLIVIELDDAEVPRADPSAELFIAAQMRLIGLVRRAVDAIARGCVVIAQGEGVVVLRPVASGAAASRTTKQLADTLRAHVNRGFRETDRTVSVGIGGRCEGLADFGRRYAEARKALHASRSLGLKDRTQTLDSLGVYGILSQDGNQEALAEFALRVLGPLLEHDHRRHTALVETLDVYLNARCALRRTAARLQVHPNTVRGRLKRIQEVGELDLANAKVLLNLQLALEIYRLRREAPPGSAGRPPAFEPIS